MLGSYNSWRFTEPEFLKKINCSSIFRLKGYKIDQKIYLWKTFFLIFPGNMSMSNCYWFSSAKPKLLQNSYFRVIRQNAFVQSHVFLTLIARGGKHISVILWKVRRTWWEIDVKFYSKGSGFLEIAIMVFTSQLLTDLLFTFKDVVSFSIFHLCF